MAYITHEDIEALVETENTALLTGRHSDTGGRGGTCRRRLLFLGRIILHLGCLGYNLYLIWLLTYLNDNPYYWLLSFVPVLFQFLGPLCERTTKHVKVPASISVVVNLTVCFTMLTRLAYYHRQPDEFIGPRFIIMSLQGSIILIVLDFFLQREGKVRNLPLKFKDALNRMLLDFVDIFNMVEILSANECVGVGSFVSEGSSTENAIQAFCTLSCINVVVALYYVSYFTADDENNENNREESTTYHLILFGSCSVQNLPFLVIRMDVLTRYRFYQLGFLVKNVFALIIYSVETRRKNKQDRQQEMQQQI